MNKIFISALMCFSMTVSVAPVLAVPVTWTFEDAVFDDGGELTGSFVYDATLNQYSSIVFVAGAGTDLPAQQYGGLHPVLSGNSRFLASVPDPGNTPVGSRLTYVTFVRNLDDSGGVVDLFLGAGEAFEDICKNPICTSLTSGRVLVSGRVRTPQEKVDPAIILLILNSQKIENDL
jgi:hypothetical protein